MGLATQPPPELEEQDLQDQAPWPQKGGSR
jgi:hypothetical protein